MFSFSRGHGGNQPTTNQQRHNNSNSNNNSSRNTASQLLRKQQVTALFNENKTVREKKDGVYEIGLMLSDKKTIITLRIALGDGFPVTAPVLQIMTHALHPWLSNDGFCRVVGHPELVNWNPHCNLGKIVKETVQEFCDRPPILSKPPNTPGGNNNSVVGSGNTGFGRNNIYNNNNNNRNNNNNMQQQQQRPSETTSRRRTKHTRKSSTFNVLDNAIIPSKFDKVNTLENDDMDILMQDERQGEYAMKCFVNTLKCVRNWDGVLNDQLKMNANKANENLKYKDDLNTQEAAIRKLQIALKNETSIYKQHLKRKEKIQDQFKPSKIVDIVENGCEEADEKSLEILNEFLDEEIELKPFLKSYVKMKKKYHRRRALLERYKVTHGL